MARLDRQMAENETRLAASGGLAAALHAVVEDARKDNVAHLELAVSPAALAGPLGSIEGALDALALASSALPAEGRPTVGWLVSVAASVSRNDLAQMAGWVRERMGDGILGVVLRLAADDPPEADDQLSDNLPSDLPIMVQLAPDISPDVILPRLTRLAPARVAFGNAALRSLDAMGWIRQNRPAQVVCLSAERSIGMGSSDPVHPMVGMIQAGMQVGLATWAPGLLERTLTNEYRLAADQVGLTLETLRGLTLASVQASFLPERQKRHFEREFEATIFGFPTGA